MSSEEIIFLAILYTVALAFGKLTAFLWWWVRIPGIVFFSVGIWTTFAVQEINFNVILVVIIPIIIFSYPSIKKMFNIRGFSNPFSFILNYFAQKRYMNHRLKEMELERETYERLEKITRMQTEEAERQRQYEREKERVNYENRRRNNTDNNERKNTKDNTKQEDSFSDKNLTLEKAYEILGVKKDMSKQEIRKAYLKLMSENAPDKVSHMSKAFQDLAHERCIQFNLAWEKINKG